eukprot:g1465.t1
MKFKKKRKNAGVGIDFRKVKRKLGKKLPKAQNATDTNIKTRSIHVPNQLATEGTAVSKRNVTLKELITQAGHYNSKIRRDAFNGLSELFRSNPSELKGQLSSLLHLIGEHVCDGDSSVRAANHLFMMKTIFSSIDLKSVSPFLAILLAQVGSALTHFDSEVAADGVKFLSLLLNEYGSAICYPYLKDTVNHFLHLLGESRPFRKMEFKAQSNLVQVLDTLYLVFKKETKSSEANPADGPNHTGSIFSSRCFHCAIHFSFSSEASTNASDENQTLRSLVIKLKSVLESNLIFLEDLSETKEEAVYQSIVIKSLKCISLITKSISVVEIRSDHELLAALQALYEIVKSQFPWYSDSGDSSERCNIIGSFNLEAADILVLLWKLKIKTQDSITSKQLNQFYKKVLCGIIEEPQTGWKSAELMLGALESWIKIQDSSDRHEMLMIVIDCCIALTNQPQTQLKFLQVLQKATSRGLLYETNLDPVVMKFVQILPEMLWKTKRKSMKNIKTCLQILHFIARTGSNDVQCILGELQPQFYLFVLIKQQMKNGCKYAPGPAMQWPNELQLLLMDCLFYLPISSQYPLDTAALKYLCQNTEFPVCFISRLLTVASTKLELAERKMVFQCLVQELLREGDSERLRRLRSEIISIIISERLAEVEFIYGILQQAIQLGKSATGLNAVARLVSANIDTLWKSDQILQSQIKKSFSRLMFIWFVQIYEHSTTVNRTDIANLDTSLKDALNQFDQEELLEWISVVSYSTEMLNSLIQMSKSILEEDINIHEDTPIIISAMVLTLAENEALTKAIMTEKTLVDSLILKLEQAYTKQDAVPTILIRLSALLENLSQKQPEC